MIEEVETQLSKESIFNSPVKISEADKRLANLAYMNLPFPETERRVLLKESCRESITYDITKDTKIVLEGSKIYQSVIKYTIEQQEKQK